MTEIPPPLALSARGEGNSSGEVCSLGRGREKMDSRSGFDNRLYRNRKKRSEMTKSKD
jgi:hypothetical protein